MARSQLELMVLYQDIDLMLKETEEEEKEMGFSVEGKEKLQKARDDLRKTIDPQLLGTYNRLSTRYKRVIAPVQGDTCLGCFAKLPTSYTSRGRNDQSIITCEQCGRILYWID